MKTGLWIQNNMKQKNIPMQDLPIPAIIYFSTWRLTGGLGIGRACVRHRGKSWLRHCWNSSRSRCCINNAGLGSQTLHTRWWHPLKLFPLAFCIMKGFRSCLRGRGGWQSHHIHGLCVRVVDRAKLFGSCKIEDWGLVKIHHPNREVDELFPQYLNHHVLILAYPICDISWY